MEAALPGGVPTVPSSPPCVFQYESKSRMSAEAALAHPYFRSLGERVHQLEDSECSDGAGPRQSRECVRKQNEEARGQVH